jgi:pyruvate formate lyase activating enzyme
MDSGVIFDIKKYAIHDGPGIRTTVFLKGCPLSCWWCHNPEGQAAQPELTYQAGKCINNCNRCVETCPNGAISRTENGIEIDRAACLLEGACADICPTGALNFSGKTMTTKDVMQEIIKDRMFYENSGGGVTFSGGEPLMQLDFLESLLEDCRKEELHRIVDTSGYIPFDSFERILDKVNLFFYDLKVMDDAQHKETTGVSNQLILENLKKLDKSGAVIQIRIPVIPGVNDTRKNTRKTVEFLTRLKHIKMVNLLPYHRAAAQKYRSLGKIFKYPEIKAPTGESVREIKTELESYGFTVQIGG